MPRTRYPDLISHPTPHWPFEYTPGGIALTPDDAEGTEPTSEPVVWIVEGYQVDFAPPRQQCPGMVPVTAALSGPPRGPPAEPATPTPTDSPSATWTGVPGNGGHNWAGWRPACWACQ